MVRKSADGTKEKFAGTRVARPIYCNKSAPRGMLFGFDKAWLQYLKNEMVFFGILSLETQNALLILGLQRQSWMRVKRLQL